jgi:hypothetical protein
MACPVERPIDIAAKGLNTAAGMTNSAQVQPYGAPSEKMILLATVLQAENQLFL